jgi:hypothetical protein
MTKFADGIFQYGGAPVGLPFFPALRAGAKVFFVDPASGDNSNSGLKPSAALDTVAAAFAKTTDKQGDVVVLLGDGSTTGTSRDSAIVWDHSNTHLIGVTAPAPNKRARIAPPSTDAADVDAYTPYITVSGSGCIFSNFSLYQGNTEDGKASVGILNSGSRNYFSYVDILTGCHANQGDEASYALVNTGSENMFESCYIGQDTYARGNNAVSANVRFGDGTGSESGRNIFRNCFFPCWADDTEPTFITNTFVTDIFRWNLFDNCTFINTGTSSLDAGVKVAGSSTGVLLFKDCGFYGVTDVTAADNTATVFLCGHTPGTPVDNSQFKGVDIS